jgi:hypothetical protein
MKRLAGLTSAAGLVFTVACGQTDAGITTAVKSKLAADDTVKAYQVNVTTENKVVTLEGEVDSAAAETMAIQIARDTDGVTDVIDEIRVVETAPTSGIDVDVDVDDDVEADARVGAELIGDATKRGAEAVGDAAKRGAQAVGSAAKKTGAAVKDAVTDDDRDSDNDGK